MLGYPPICCSITFENLKIKNFALFVHVKHLSCVTFCHLSNRYLSNIMKISAKMYTICTDTCLDTLFTFQQDSALAHHAHETIGLFQHETPKFISPGLTYGHLTTPSLIQSTTWCGKWWSIVSRRADELKECLIAVWFNFRRNIIDTAIDQLRKHLRGNGGHFEHLL